MAPTQHRGNTLMPGSVTLDRLVTGYQIPTANLAQGSLFTLSTGFTMTGGIAMGGNPITGGPSPVNATDFAIKSYVDALVSGFSIHGATLVATANIGTLSGYVAVDGVTPSAPTVTLLTAQTTTSQNGPWVQNSGAWTRPTWWKSGAVIPEGNYFLIDPDGTNYKNTKWFVNTAGNITVDTTGITFVQDLSGTVYNAGGGLTLAGTTFAVNPGNGVAITAGAVTAVGDGSNLISVSASGIAITAGAAGQMIQGASSTGKASWQTMNGDATLAAGGAITVTKTGGTAFAPSATVDTTNAGNISSGTLAAARLGGSYTGITGVGTLAAGTWNASTIGVAYGGTGATTLTAHGVLIGEGTSAVAASAVGTAGQMLLGQGASADPSFQTMTGDVTLTSAGAATVNNTAGSGFTKYGNFVFGEVPTGAINSSNTTFTLAGTPQNGSLLFVVNGDVLKPGTGNDYQLSGNTITTSLQNGPMVAGDQPLAFYLK